MNLIPSALVGSVGTPANYIFVLLLSGLAHGAPKGVCGTRDLAFVVVHQGTRQENQMICTRQELFEAIKKTLAQATPQEKRQIRDALLEGLHGNRCGICGRLRMTLLFNTVSGTLQCFQCTGKDGSEPVWV